MSRFSETDASRFAEELYGLRAKADRLLGYHDQNFLLTTAAGQQFVLKIAAAEGRDVLDMQNEALAHLAEHAPEIVCPRVCPSIDGEQLVTVEASNGVGHYARLLTYLRGELFANAKPHSPELMQSLGQFLGRLDQALGDFSHPATRRNLIWDLKNAAWIKSRLHNVSDPARRALVSGCLQRFETHVFPRLGELRTSAIHNDGNDYNLIVSAADALPRKVIGIFDFGDMVCTNTVFELAIAIAYAVMGKADPLAAAAHVVRGYHEVFPLTELELELLYYLTCARLCVTVTNAAIQRKREPDNSYLTISEKPAWDTLEKLASTSPQLAEYTFRHACGLSPNPKSHAVAQWLQNNPDQIGPVTEHDLKSEHQLVFDLSVGSLELGIADLADVQALTDILFGRMGAAQANAGIGRYAEARPFYTSDLFRSPGEDGPEWRTVHLGIDLFMEAGSPVFAPLDGVVHSFQNNTVHLDYGPTIIVQHEVETGEITFFTLYGHLSTDSLEGLQPGMSVNKGDQIGRIGSPPTNGNWPPHLHFQLITDMLGRAGEFPGVAAPSQREIWLSICPDPNIILGIPEARFPAEGMSRGEILKARRQSISRSLSIAYKKPLNIVRGAGQYLYDENGQPYLDAVNNVCHVGHCHPRVVAAAQQQIAILNTNTRYLHENLVRYAERLCATLPDPLDVCFFVCTGSEANDLALRLARTHTNNTDVIVVDGAYHGNLNSLIEISPYKFGGPGGAGAPLHTHKVPMPDVYRGEYKAADPDAGAKYATHIQETIQQLQQQGRNVAAFFCESLMGCGGQIVPPEDYLKEAYRHVRNAGGVCIADEVQVGFGRVGSHFWGFETQGVIPDIVTLGKPIGNGHPLAAVVTTPEIAASFDNGMEYFNTFGGNPVSCAVGLAVLDVIEDEGLQENALRVGARLRAGLEQLKAKRPLIGEVRGLGLFIGVELVLNRETLAPAAAQAAYVVERMKEHGILISTDGALHNVLKIKPPLVFSEANADRLVDTLDKILDEDFLAVVSKQSTVNSEQ